MGLFSKLFSKDKSKKAIDFGYIREIAAVICGSDPDVMNNIENMLSHPQAYFTRTSGRYDERGIDVDKAESKTLYWIGMTDELIEGGYVAEVDYKCELEDFLWSLQQLKNYPLIADVIAGLSLNESENVDAWGEEICLAIEGKAYLCLIDIDSDSYPVFILPPDKDNKRDNILRIEELAYTYGHTLSEF